MWILVNEDMIQVGKSSTLFSLRAERKPDADVIIFNGAQMHGDSPLTEGDRVVFIRRGEIPSREELQSMIYARHTPGVHDKIETAIVGIAGAGGLGSNVAVALGRLGVGRLVIADFDVVEPSNLNRQQYFVEQIGMPKVEALKQTLARINPYVAVEPRNLRLTPQNAPRVFQSVNALVEAFDRAEGKAMLVQSFAPAYPDTPVVMASGVAGYWPGEDIRIRRLGKNIFVVGDMTNAARPGSGLMSPRVGLAAHMQANLVLRLLLGAVKEGET
ncbi:MAG: sulfur carrier protein ThiS adenylyltransferase ThiF [Verrucomicrobiota bacterium]|nr:sulfur carrier protein ThiS adenylyltransferase ThiF [Verrucomicrobiota bacterium]